jgi:glutaminyl-peptide cyclotransferase
VRVLLLAIPLAALLAVAATGAEPAARPDRFSGGAAWSFLQRQVALGPRPAGSRASRELAAILRRSIPGGRYQAVPGGLRNVVGTIPGRNPRRKVVIGAHYDTKDLPGFVGANDGASGTAVVRQLARTIRPRQLRPTLIVVFFDGEESPRGTPDSQFERYGLRGSKVAARAFRAAESAIVLDFVGDKDLAIPRDQLSNRGLWRRLRAAAGRTGFGRHFPAREQGAVLDDHAPFIRAGTPAIDLIDFDFPCWHRRCDDLSAVSQRSLNAVGETMMAFLSEL